MSRHIAHRVVLLLLILGTLRSASAQAPRLRIEQIGADSTGFSAIAALVVGPKHVLLWDAQYHKGDAERVAEAIARTGRTLQAIILSHPDEDHYTGLGTILARFPGTPVYLTAAGLRVFDSMAPPRFRSDRARSPSLFPDTLIRPAVLPSTKLSVDGIPVEVIPDLQGDVLAPTNSALWIPSQRTLLTGDIVFRGVFPWFGASDSASRVAWRQSITRLIALRPLVVIAGHKARMDQPDSPDVLAAMDGYLAAFDSVRQRSSSAAALRDTMLARYPDHTVRMLLAASAATAFRGRGPTQTNAQASAPSSQSRDSLIRPGVWTGSVTGPGSTVNAEFAFGNKEGRLTLVLRPQGPPPIEATDVHFNGSALTFAFTLGEHRFQCTLKGDVTRGLEGNCGEVGGEAGSVEMKMTPPKS